MSSDHNDDSFDSKDETQVVNTTFNNPNTNQSLSLGDGLLALPKGPGKDSDSQRSKSIYQAPSINDYRSATQAMVDGFHDQWGHEAALNVNTRDY